MSSNPNENIEVDPAAQAPPARVASPVLGATTAEATGIKTGNQYYDNSASRNQYHGTGAGIDTTSVRGNSIERTRQMDAYPVDHKDRPDSLKKNDIEVQNGDRLTDSDIGEGSEERPNWALKQYRAHRGAITIAIHVFIGSLMTG